MVIPGFGGFVSREESARLDPKRGKVFPPGKAVAFNSELSKDDGTLNQFIAEKNGISFHEAGKWVKEEANKRIEFLEANGYLDLPELGTIKVEEGRYQFEPKEELFGELRQTGFEPVKASKLRSAPPLPKTTRRKKRGFGASVMGVLLPLLIAGGGAMFWFFPFAAEQDYDISGILSNSEPMPVQEEPSAKAQGPDGEEQPAAKEGVSQDQERASSTESSQPQPATEAFIEEENHIIVGAFSDRENAQDVIVEYQNQGFSAQILETEQDFVRVSIAAYESEEKAEENLAKIQTHHNKDAWILSE